MAENCVVLVASNHHCTLPNAGHLPRDLSFSFPHNVGLLCDHRSSMSVYASCCHVCYLLQMAGSKGSYLIHVLSVAFDA